MHRVRNQFEGAAYIIEDNIGKRPIRGRELINVRELIEEIRYVENRVSCFLDLVWSKHQNHKTNKVGVVDKFMHRDYIVTLPLLKAPVAIHLGNIVLYCTS